MIHKDIKGMHDRRNAWIMIVLALGQPDILVGDSGCPQIMAYSPAMVAQTQDSIRSLQGERGHTARLTAPEIPNEQGTHSKEANAFSFAMVMVEVRWRY